jgi:hypothetical protein
MQPYTLRRKNSPIIRPNPAFLRTTFVPGFRFTILNSPLNSVIRDSDTHCRENSTHGRMRWDGEQPNDARFPFGYACCADAVTPDASLVRLANTRLRRGLQRRFCAILHIAAPIILTTPYPKKIVQAIVRPRPTATTAVGHTL